MRAGLVRPLEDGVAVGEEVGVGPQLLPSRHALNTKSGKPRELPMDSTLRELFRALPKTGELVFDCSNLRKLYEAVVRQAKLEDVNFHTLRHTFASHLAMAGVDIKTIQELLGHQTFEMTLRYAHLSPHHKKVAIEILDSRWAKTPAVQEAAIPEVRGPEIS